MMYRSDMTHPAESLHWYTKTGEPAYEVPYADPKKGNRSATLGDARKLGLLPSVTSIIQEAAKPGLERWKQEQVLHAALTLPRIEGEPEAEFLNRIMLDSREQAKKAAERGTVIHAAIQDRKPETNHVWEVVNAWMLGEWVAEKSFAHPLGYGGKVDDHHLGAVIDYKTTDKPLAEIKTWDEHALQLAAYREGLKIPSARCAIVYISVNEPQARLIEIPEDKLQRGWLMFEALLDYWYAKTGLQR